MSLLACAAQVRDWPAWDDHLALGRPALRQSGLLDPDVAWCAELAGRLTEWAGETARAREVYELALEQYRGLENARGVQRIEKTLEQL
ncbi:MAG: hypothetical protein ACJ76N_25795 [Thermoanaerobaculia bacterium]